MVFECIFVSVELDMFGMGIFWMMYLYKMVIYVLYEIVVCFGLYVELKK